MQVVSGLVGTGVSGVPSSTASRADTTETVLTSSAGTPKGLLADVTELIAAPRVLPLGAVGNKVRYREVLCAKCPFAALRVSGLHARAERREPLFCLLRSMTLTYSAGSIRDVCREPSHCSKVNLAAVVGQLLPRTSLLSGRRALLSVSAPEGREEL